jgi:uridylate kinase
MPASKVPQRLVLKISGESLAPAGQLGIDTQELQMIAGEIASACELGGQIAVVVGGGNIIRGARLAKDGGLHGHVGHGHQWSRAQRSAGEHRSTCARDERD